MVNFQDFAELFHYFEIQCVKILKVDGCALDLHEPLSNKLVTWKEDRLVVLAKCDGLVNQTIREKRQIQINEPANNCIYNPLVDIETNLPILSIPICNQKNVIIGVYQIINLKGF